MCQPAWQHSGAGFVPAEFYVGKVANEIKLDLRPTNAACYRDGAAETCLAESHAAMVKHSVIRAEKAMGTVNR